MDVQIIKGHISPDHVHLLVSVPPYLSISRLVQYIKGTSSRKLQMEFKELRQRYWGKHFWVRGYFCATTGVVTEEQIRDYIENHTKEDDENFTIGKS